MPISQPWDAIDGHQRLHPQTLYRHHRSDILPDEYRPLTRG